MKKVRIKSMYKETSGLYMLEKYSTAGVVVFPIEDDGTKDGTVSTYSRFIPYTSIMYMDKL